MYLNAMGFKAIEPIKGVGHNTIIYWVKQLGEKLPNVAKQAIPEVGQLDELATFIGAKNQSLAVDSRKSL